MTKVAVLGSGVIGSSWVKAFLAGGYTVAVWDPAPQAAAVAVRDHQQGVQVVETAEEAVSGADFIQESGPESMSAKRELLFRIANLVGEQTIVASSTSTLMPSQIQKGIPFANRFLIGHPFNPPHILPLVEVLGGEHTEAWAINRALSFYAELGKHPIHLRRERPGHLANRLQAALWREAVDAVACGQATVEDVDAAVALALGPRWALMGPFATFNLAGGEGGLAHFLDHLGPAFEALWDDAHRPIVTAQLEQSFIDAVDKLSDGRSKVSMATERNTKLGKILSLARHPLAQEQGD